ncbi:hypothetical protein VNO77_01973 [Canavalia gladiata]|uniref:Uncharacterized protein n=1 Tax=Canavalia gladiata TaxID=3824 RepID=A0AAN9MSV8_CANGL
MFDVENFTAAALVFSVMWNANIGNRWFLFSQDILRNIILFIPVFVGTIVWILSCHWSVDMYETSSSLMSPAAYITMSAS